MSDTAIAAPPRTSLANGALQTSGIIWFLLAVIGQWTFVYYILVAFGGPAVAGNPEAWNDTQPIHGYIAGDLIGNLFFASHVLLAAVITFGGTLQLVPQIRAHFIGFHRWNGRVFMTVAFIMAISGIYMAWGPRETRLTDIGGIGVSLNGVLIMIAATMALRHVFAKRIDQHRRWAMRTFILVNGVWFYRVGFMGWIIVNQGPLGSTSSLDGPFDLTIAFASYLLPLGILELYFRAQDSHNAGRKWLTSGLLLAATAFMAVGIFGAYMFMWSPHL
jgi:hypothetical protein